VLGEREGYVILLETTADGLGDEQLYGIDHGACIGLPKPLCPVELPAAQLVDHPVHELERGRGAALKSHSLA